MNWDAARQLAASIATEGDVRAEHRSARTHPARATRAGRRAQVAQRHHAADVEIGPRLARSSRSRGTMWMQRTLDAYRRAVRVARRIDVGRHAHHDRAGRRGRSRHRRSDGEDARRHACRSSARCMLGMTIGSMLGHLARRSFGQYDLPIPRPPSDELMIAARATSTSSATEWSLPKDDLRLWVCVHEVARHTVLVGAARARARLDSLLTQYVSGFEPDPNALEHRLGEFDISRSERAAEAARAARRSRGLARRDAVSRAARAAAAARSDRRRGRRLRRPRDGHDR